VRAARDTEASEADGSGSGGRFESGDESVASSPAAAAERAPRRRASSGDVLRGRAHRAMMRAARLHSAAGAAPG